MYQPIDALSLLPFLGHSPSSEPFDSWLDAHRVFDRPHSAEDDDAYDDDPNEAFENARDSEIEDVERDSVTLVYDELEAYELLFGAPKSEGEYVFREAVFYAEGFQDYPGYQGQLPFGLKLAMNQDAVHALMGAPTASRQVHALPSDLYISDKLVVNISYLDQGASIGVVHVRLPHMYDLQALDKEGVAPNPDAVKLDALTACLGKGAYDPRLEALLEPMGWQAGDFKMAGAREVSDLTEEFGLTLFYRDAKDYPALDEQKFLRDGTVLAGFRVNRRGDLYSEGYDGALPFGMQYYYAPEQAIACVGSEPNRTAVGDDIGAYMWKFPTHTLHVMFSLIDYQIYRVSCFAKFMEEELFSGA